MAAQRICDAKAVCEAGTGVRFCVRIHGETHPAFLVRYDGCVHGYINACAHRAVELDWLPGEFFDAERRHLICATHGARYEPATGRCLAGPCAGGALTPVAVREAHGTIFLVGGDGIDLCPGD